MFMHLSPKERIGYIVLAAVLLSGGGFVLAQRLRKPAPIELHETPQPPVSFDHGGTNPANGEMAPTSSPSASNSRESQGRQVVVHVAGAVVNPGIVALPAESRAYDAVKAAGGPTEDANLDGINLAQKLSDGTQVYVPRRGVPSSAAPTSATPPTSGRRTSRLSQSKYSDQIVDINSADVSLIRTLPGVGLAMAQRIVDYRVEHGSFRTIDDLLVIQGFGRKRLDQIRDRVVAYSP